MIKEEVMAAMRAVDIPSKKIGCWSITKRIGSTISSSYSERYGEVIDENKEYTFLSHYTFNGPECVMEDTPKELMTHLNFIMKSKGDILVSGLGLGCVVRGLLKNKDVEKITVVEKSIQIIDSVWPYMPTDNRLNILHGCAIDYPRYKEKYDYAWHDIWIPESGKHLDYYHGQMIIKNLNLIKKQGAWKMDKRPKVLFKRHGVWYD